MTQPSPTPTNSPGGSSPELTDFPPPPPLPPPAYTPPGGAQPGGAWPPGPAGPGYAVPPPPPVSPGGQPLATFLDRFLAHLIDAGVFMVVGMIIAIPAVIIFFVVIGPDLFQVSPDGSYVEPDFFTDFFVPFLLLELGVFVASLVLSYVYYVEMMFRTGQTLGKKFMKIKTVPIDPAGTLNRTIAAKRYLVQNVASVFVPGLGYVDGLWQLWDKPYQQCLHDKFAQTVVVKVPA